MSDRQMNASQERRGHHKGTIVTSSLFLVPGLAISAWSLYGYLRGAGAPMWLSAGASAAVDGLGLFSAAKAHAFTERGIPTRLPRWVTYAMVVASVYINWQHASAQHWSRGIHLLIALPAAAAAAAFEIILLETRAIEREKHEPRGRTRRSVKIDVDIWIHHPFMVWGARRRESADRLRAVLSPSGALAGQDTAAIITPAPSADTAAITGQDMSAPAPAQEDIATVTDIASEDITPAVSAPDTATDTDTDMSSDQRQDTDTDATDNVIALPRQSGGRGRRGRTSETDAPDVPADVASLVPAALLEQQETPSVPAVVRQVWRDDWDTGTIKAVVQHVLPDAKPDTITKAIGRHRAARRTQGTDYPPAAGQYL